MNTFTLRCRDFYAYYPEEKVRLVRLRSHKFRNTSAFVQSPETVASSFVDRQLELMKQGMSEQEAFDTVDALFREEESEWGKRRKTPVGDDAR